MNNLEELPLNEYRECIKVRTDKGTEMATNLVIICNGIRINSFAYHSTFGKQEAEPLPTPQTVTSFSSLPRRPHRPLPKESVPPYLPLLSQQLMSLLNGDIQILNSDSGPLLSCSSQL